MSNATSIVFPHSGFEPAGLNGHASLHAPSRSRSAPALPVTVKALASVADVSRQQWDQLFPGAAEGWDYFRALRARRAGGICRVRRRRLCRRYADRRRAALPPLLSPRHVAAGTAASGRRLAQQACSKARQHAGARHGLAADRGMPDRAPARSERRRPKHRLRGAARRNVRSCQSCRHLHPGPQGRHRPRRAVGPRLPDARRLHGRCSLAGRHPAPAVQERAGVSRQPVLLHAQGHQAQDEEPGRRAGRGARPQSMASRTRSSPCSRRPRRAARPTTTPSTRCRRPISARS